MQKQVNKSHYEFGRYIHKGRWMSMWHQLDEVKNFNPRRVLEIGPGPGFFKAIAEKIGIRVETLDLDPELAPDHIASVLELPFGDKSFDVVCAFQMLEHLPFEHSLKALQEMIRVSSKAVIISLPDAATRWPFSIHIPKIGVVKVLIPKLRLFVKEHKFDGEHYWEINKAGYELRKVTSALLKNASVRLLRTYRVHEYSYHRFYVLEKLPVGKSDGS